MVCSRLGNVGTKGFSKDQLKGKQLLLMFRPDALVIFRANFSPEDIFRSNFSPEDVVIFRANFSPEAVVVFRANFSPEDV